jgi:predicted DNA-binding WGR domain protein
MHGERLKLWMDFNHCWLAVLQRQREMTYDWQQTGQRPAGTSSMLEYDQMETMGRDLVRLCDVMEKHGLVDYQMGVWEEEIIHRKLTLMNRLHLGNC